MYISMTVLRIIFIVLFAVILYVNFSISYNDNIPKDIQKKVGTVSLVIVIIMIAVSAFLGIFPSE